MRSTALRDVESMLIVDPASAVLAVFARDDYEPPMLPAAALRIHEVTRRGQVAASEVVSILETDPILAADFLRHADSPVFATRHAVTGLLEAVMRMGLNTVERIVWEIAFSGKVFRSKLHGAAMESFRRHSVATAKIACVVAEKSGIEGPAFLSGLLHDVGVAAVLMVHEAISRRDPAWLTVDLGPCLARSHEQAGRVVCDSWALPSEVGEIAGAHQRPITGPDLRGCVSIADAMAQVLSLGLSADVENIELAGQSLSEAWVMMGLEPSELPHVLERLRPLLSSDTE